MLPTWFEYVEKAFNVIDVAPEYAFVVGSCTDNTVELMNEITADKTGLVVCSSEPAVDLSQNRNWTDPKRYQEMADCRNQLLELVQRMQPDYFLSLDSDILLNPKTLPLLLEDLKEHEDWWAVGSKLYMTRAGRHAPSYAEGNGMGGLVRPDSDGVFSGHNLTIMALKLMDPRAYRIDYTGHSQGEDIGWSTAVRSAGGKLGWDGRTTSKHVMQKRQLYEVDPRCSY